jgi:hypothetical protein
MDYLILDELRKSEVPFFFFCQTAAGSSQTIGKYRASFKRTSTYATINIKSK